MRTTAATAVVAALTVAGIAAALPTSSSTSVATVTPPQYSNRIIFIRHAEKGFATMPPDSGEPGPGGPGGPGGPPNDGPPPPPPHGPRGPGGPGGGRRKMPSGLSEEGKERAQYLRTLFGEDSEYNFGLIFATPWDVEKKEGERTYATVAPLAEDLGVEIEIGCANSPTCVADKVWEFVKTSDADILISWKHRELHVIATALGAPNAKIHYPDERNDILWIMQDGRIVEKRSMHMPGLDDGHVDKGDSDLEVEEESEEKGLIGWIYATWSSLLF